MNSSGQKPKDRQRLTRRSFLTGTGSVISVGLAGAYPRDRLRPLEPVVVARAARYDDSLVEILRRGLVELGISREQIAGKRVLLKPNLVEPSASAPHINTDPRLVQAAVEVMRGFDAAQVRVAEGQGHCRDSYLVLQQSGFDALLEESRVPFVDLNHDEVHARPNLLGRTHLTHFYLPQTLLEADIIVSMPKLKTHHWVGMTLSMKNLFGVLPGICYGWPKNVLHQAGIAQSILDITSAVQPHLAIVDGIIGMEGDGPIMGQPRESNLIIIGSNPAAVDATGARLMGLDPQDIPYLVEAPQSGIGPIDERSIEQRGETIASLRQRYELLDHPLMQRFRPTQ